MTVAAINATSKLKIENLETDLAERQRETMLYLAKTQNGLLTLHQAARYLGCTPRRLYDAIKRGRLQPTYKETTTPKYFTITQLDIFNEQKRTTYIAKQYLINSLDCDQAYALEVFLESDGRFDGVELKVKYGKPCS